MDELIKESVPDNLLGSNRWPQADDRLLRVSSWKNGARFREHPFARASYISDGYMRAGALLVAECERDQIQSSILIYPILFCYRHALEAALKCIVSRYGDYAGIVDYKKSHDLVELWRLCRLTLAALHGDGDVDAMTAIESVVTEFDDLDKRSFSFRYPTDTNGKPIELPDAPIDLVNVRDVMEGIDAFFTAVDGLLDANTWVISDSYHYALQRAQT